MRAPARRVVEVAVGLLCMLSSCSAFAAPLELTATPVLGDGPVLRDGWASLWARVENTGATAQQGTVELSAGPARRTHAPFSVAPGQSIVVELSSHDLAGTPLELSAIDSAGRTLAEHDVAASYDQGPLLVDLSSPSLLASALEGETVARTVASPVIGPTASPALSVSSPPRDGATGEPRLPERAASYASATVVVALGHHLRTMSADSADALAGWVLGGGTLALALDRPEDLRSDRLAAFVGGTPERRPATERLGRPAVFRRPDEGAGPFGRGGGGTAPREEWIAPSPAARRNLVDYAGGNLRRTRWGSVASYGLGEVHLLAFDPTDPEAVRDPWVRYSTLELVSHAADRRAHVAFSAARPLADGRIAAVRRLLDPHEQIRWAVVVSAIALLIYAVAAGPISFRRAARQGRPLRALLFMPLWSLGATAFVLTVGLVAKGGSSRARHLALVEAGAGFSRASATRFRAFITSSADTLTIGATDRDSLLDVAGDGETTRRTLVLDRSGARLTQLVTRPWETLVVREDGFADLGGGVSVLATGSGDLSVDNRVGRELVGVIVKPAGEAPRYFARLADGERVLASDGRPVPWSGPAPAPAAGIEPLRAHRFSSLLDADFPRLGEAWTAVDGLLGATTDWWPPDVPVVMAQVAGGEGRTEDGGLPMDTEYFLLRVVGYGGQR